MTAVNRKSVTTQSLLMILFSGVTSAVTLLIYSLAARNLPISDVAEGILMATVAWYLTSLIDFGGSAYAVREIMGERTSLSLVRYFGVIKIFLLIPLIGVSLIIFHSQMGLVIRVFILTLLLLAINLLTIEFRVNGFTSSLSVITFTEKVSLLILLLMSITLKLDIRFLDLILISNLLAFLLAIYLSDYSNLRLSRTDIKGLFVGSLGIGASSAITQIQILDINLLALKIGTSAASPYVLITRWTNVIGIFTNVFSQAIAPIVAKKNLTKDDILEISKNSYLIILSLLFCILVAFQADNLVNFFLGDNYANTGEILKVLALATVFSTVAQPLSTILQNRQNPWKVTFVLFVGVLIQFVYILLFASDVGALAAANGFLLSQVTTTCLFIFFARGLIRKYFESRSYKYERP